MLTVIAQTDKKAEYSSIINMLITYQRKYEHKVKNLYVPRGSAKAKLRLPDTDEFKPSATTKEADDSLGIGQ